MLLVELLVLLCCAKLLKRGFPPKRVSNLQLAKCASLNIIGYPILTKVFTIDLAKMLKINFKVNGYFLVK